MVSGIGLPGAGIVFREGLSVRGRHLRALDSAGIEDSERVRVMAEVQGEGSARPAVEQVVGRLSLEPAVTAACRRDMPGEAA